MTSILAASSCFGKTNNGYELSGISTLKDMNNNSETSSVSGMIRPLVDIADRKLLHVGVVLGPIPNLFKWLQNELNRVEKALQNSLVMINNRSNQSQTLVELALTKEEQNMEIVLINEQYYFEVVRSFRVQQKSANHDHYSVGTPPTSGSSGSDLKTDFGEKPKAWFCKEIEERISTIRPAQTWLNGKELFCCLLCNHFSFYSNHLMLHMMFDCPKKPHSQQNLSGDNGSRSTNNGQQQQQQHPIESLTKAKIVTNQIMVDFNQNQNPNNSKNQKQIRSFDIMSLLNNGKNEDKDDEEVDVETLDSNEETIQTTLKVLNHNVHPLKQNTKRQTDSKLQHHQQHNLYHQTILIGPNQSKECPPPPLQSSSLMKKFNGNRKYSNKCGKISKSFNSPPSSGNNKKSAFKKFPNNKNIKTSNKLNPQQQLFISNQANSTNFHNQFSAPPTHTNGAATNALFSFANLFRSNNQSGSNQNRISNLSSPNSSTESIPLISQLYPLISSNTNSHNHLVTNGQLSQNKLLAISPTGAQQQPSTSNLFENNISNNITVSTMDQSSSIKTIGNISLESNSPTLSESSGSLISLPNSPAYTASANYSTNNNHSDDNNINKSNDEKNFHDSEPSSTIQLLPQSAQSTMANNPLFNLPPYFMPPTSTAASNPLITSLYLLSPSLTALSYQASNVCAYCNTAFRMTSDLVYHMRSHHKRTKSNEDQVNKKRRDDQLRCHICNETFRERHHLTRHMTSHQ